MRGGYVTVYKQDSVKDFRPDDVQFKVAFLFDSKEPLEPARQYEEDLLAKLKVAQGLLQEDFAKLA